MQRVVSAISELGLRKWGKRHLWQIVLGGVLMLVLLAAGAYSIYHYGSAAPLFDQKHAARPRLASQKLSQPTSYATTINPTNSRTAVSNSVAMNQLPDATITQPTPSTTPSTAVATNLPTDSSCTASPSQQAQITKLQAELSTVKQQQSQLLQNQSGLLGQLSASVQQQLQQVQAQINALTMQLQTAQLVTC